MYPPITTLVFDWGDTLMLDDPRFTGSMADWPEVSAIPGVQRALTELAGQYRLAVATNAGYSNAQKVRAALQRVNLDQYFSRIYTSAELGTAKPALEYYRAIEADLAASPTVLLMVGDSYQKDILGACRAGWRSIWYNPNCQSCTGLTPLHSAEINHMADLPSAMRNLNLPTVADCLLWLRQQDASFYLLQHVQAVAASAYQIALWLRTAGYAIDPILAHRGGLLHDLGKIKSLRGQSAGLNHGAYAAKILDEMGYPQLAQIAQRHLLFSITQTETAPRTLEDKVVYFCDKIVENSQVVPLTERIARLQQRYAHDQAKIQACLPPLLKMQEELCASMRIPVSEFIPRLSTALLEN
jgi:putative hydrolase of the HAD superfamily